MGGDEAAYAAFLTDVAARIRGFARRKTSQDGVDPEDVVQETLLAIHLKRHTWRRDAAVLPWVFAIARFKLIDAFRRRGRRVEIDIDEFSEILAGPEKETLGPRDIERALGGLASTQRAVVASLSVDGRTVSETASALGMTEAAVRVAFHRGLRAIARRFGQN